MISLRMIWNVEGIHITHIVSWKQRAFEVSSKSGNRWLCSWLSGKSACCTGMRTWIQILAPHIRSWKNVSRSQTGRSLSSLASQLSLLERSRFNERTASARQGGGRFPMLASGHHMKSHVQTHIYMSEFTHMHAYACTQKMHIYTHIHTSTCIHTYI